MTMPKPGVTTAAGRKRKIEEIRATARFGQFPIPADMSPVDILMDELKRSAGFCFWIETKMSEWTDGLIELGATNYDDKGAMQTAPTNEREWIGIWQSERKHLATVAKMCIDAGVDERRVQLAERQSELMFMLINEAFDMLQLTAEQQARVPKIMPALIRQMAIPGEVVASDADH
ncbi:hypothetical protein SEA_CROSBY_67 [Streptomyces phage Crosby]|nr:hypothetical protein SEA_CROSBY_67 [Streptomyces phage Crosby]